MTDFTKPWIPEGFELIEHTPQEFDWDVKKVELYLNPQQKEGSIDGEELYRDVKNRKPLNSAVLKYLLDNQHLIPKEWNEYWGVCFWGTLLRGPGGYRSFLCLCRRDGGRWDWGCRWLGFARNAGLPALVFASSQDLDTQTSDVSTRLLALEVDMKKLKKIINL